MILFFSLHVLLYLLASKSTRARNPRRSVNPLLTGLLSLTALSLSLSLSIHLLEPSA